MPQYVPELTANLARLAQMPENEPFRSWVQQTRDEQRDLLETTRDATLFVVTQGRAQMLAEIQKMMASSLASRK